MLSKNKIKQIKSLEYKKFREQENVFLVEGEKLTKELIVSNFPIQQIYATADWIEINNDLTNNVKKIIEPVTQEELNKASLLKTPQKVIGLATIPRKNLNTEDLKNKLSLVLDSIQDPGNLGTIIRIADWFGIENIVCNLDTADCYNPKVVQATMGAIFRVNIYYLDLFGFFNSIKNLNLPVYGTFLDGKNIYNNQLSKHALILMGNESKGIDTKYLPFISNKILIPYYPEGIKRSESLNVGIATAITCAEFRRQESSI